MQVQHEIGNYFAKNTNGKIKVRVIRDTFKLKSFFRVKEGQALLHRSNAVYHIHCSCGSNYIGETARNLLTRLNEHNPGSKKCKNTDVTNHLYENSDHKIDFAKLCKIYLELPGTEPSIHFRNFKHRQTETGHKR